MSTVPEITEYLYQQFHANSTCMFDAVFLCCVTNRVKGVLVSFIPCLRYSGIYCMGLLLILHKQDGEAELEGILFL